MNDEAHTISGNPEAESRWSLEQLTTTWFQLETQINPFSNVISLPGGLFRSFDDGAKQFVANAFMKHTSEAAMFCRDGTGHDRYFLGNPRHFIQSNGVIMDVSGSEPFWFPCVDNLQSTKLVVSPPLLSLSKAKEKKIPRPPNAYILYRKERHSLVKETNPGITNNEISQVLGSAWNNESREVRQKYKDMADEIKDALFKAHPDYQYKPRKPSEKKRRARRNTRPQHGASHEDGNNLSMLSPYTNSAEVGFNAG